MESKKAVYKTPQIDCRLLGEEVVRTSNGGLREDMDVFGADSFTPLTTTGGEVSE